MFVIHHLKNYFTLSTTSAIDPSKQLGTSSKKQDEGYFATIQKIVSFVSKILVDLVSSPLHYFSRPVANLPHNLIYREATRRIKPEQLISLEKTLKSIPSQEIDRFLHKLKTRDWDFESLPRYPYCALSALKNGKISVYQFATVMRYYAIRLEHQKDKIEIIQIFDENGVLNQEADKIIRSSLRLPKNHPYVRNTKIRNSKDNNHLDATEFTLFYDKLKTLPFSEQVIFCFPILKSHLDTRLALTADRSLPLHSFKKEGQEKHILAATSVIETLFHVMYPKNLAKMNPVLGCSSLEDIRQNGLSSTRDNAISFPGLPLPKSADNNSVGQEYTFTRHDDYHLWMAHAIPAEQQKKFIKVADIIDQHMKKASKELLFPLTKLKEEFIDMDHQLFRCRFFAIDITDDELFSQEIVARFSDMTCQDSFQQSLKKEVENIKEEFEKEGLLPKRQRAAPPS